MRTIVANLVTDFGDRTREPSAHYACHRCGFRTRTVVGHRAVAEFNAKAAEGTAAHRAVCPAAPQETTQ